MDLTRPREAEAWVEATRARFGTIDVLVNLVGGVRKPSLDYSLDDWQHVMDINMKACWIACQAGDGGAEAGPHRELLLHCRPTRWAGPRCSWPRTAARWINGHRINVDTGFNAT